MTMKNQFKSIVFLFALSSLGIGSSFGDGLSAIHPGYDLADIQPTGNKFLVGGIDVFSDGRLAVCQWGNPGEVWIVSGAETGSSSTVKSTKYAYGLQQVLGCKVVQDTLYVLQIGELTQLVDVDGDGIADQYNKINDAFPTSESLLGLAYDVVYYGGSFYVALSADVGFGGMDAQPSQLGRSTAYRLGRDNSLEALATGFRNPNGMGLGFGNKIFSSDNQGSWLPSSKLINIQKGKFYGHHSVPPNLFENQTESPPMCWLPHGEVSSSPGSLLYLSEGIFKNQLLFGEEHRGVGGGRIYRVSVQDVGGVLQGAVIPFSSAIGTGVNRLTMGKGGIIYTGLLGADGGWSSPASMNPGLKRLKPKNVNNSYAFEMLAVRSSGASTIEIEFTSAPAADATNPAHYTAETWNFVPIVEYGGGNKLNSHALTVQSATLKPDGKTVVLTIGGLLEKYLVHIKLAGLLSATGTAPWGSETWLTLNKYGPGTDVAVSGCMDVSNPAYNPNATVNDPAGCTTVAIGAKRATQAMGPLQKLGSNRIRLALPENQDYALEMFDLRGVRQGSWLGTGPKEIHLKDKPMTSGVYELRLKAGKSSWTQLYLITP